MQHFDRFGHGWVRQKKARSEICTRCFTLNNSTKSILGCHPQADIPFEYRLNLIQWEYPKLVRGYREGYISQEEVIHKMIWEDFYGPVFILTAPLVFFDNITGEVWK